MAISLAELIILSLLVDWVFRKIKIPGLVGMLIVGVITGPYVLQLMKPEFSTISADLRMIALIVILLRKSFHPYFAGNDFVLYPVVDASNALSEVIRLDNLQHLLAAQETWEWLVAKDVATPLPHSLASHCSKMVFRLPSISCVTPFSGKRVLDILGRNHRIDIDGRVRPRHFFQNFMLVGLVGILDAQLQHEAIYLRFRQGIGSFLLDGILGGHYQKRIIQGKGRLADRDLAFLHGFKQGALHLGRRAVDFISQDNI